MSSVPSLRLRRLDGDLDEAVPLKLGVNVVGRGPESEVCLGHEGVSRRHALLVVRLNEVLLIDCESKNGTRVDGDKIRSAVVEPGARISFGLTDWKLESVHPDDTALAFSLSPPPEAVSPPPAATTRRGRERTRSPDRLLLAERMLAIARSDAEHPGAAILEELIARLGVDGVAEVVLDADEPTVLRSHGNGAELDLAGFLAACDEELTGSEEGAALVAHGATLGFARRMGRRIHALVVPADVPAGRATAALLSITVMLLDLVSRREPSAPLATAAEQVELTFPPGYHPSRSPAMEPVYRQLRALADGSLSVLLVGETGVGKDCLVEALHRSSPRREGPLVAINCAALPAELLEAELFGIGDRVATGVSGRVGRFREAQGGTLFLDEIAEMPVELQAKLLRVLEQRRVESLGTGGYDIDVRLVAATNAELDRLVAEGSFRSDLFYRLAGSVVRVPPLRSRRQDISGLVEIFARRAADETGREIQGLSLRALRRLVSHDWPGNVRELKHVTTRLVYHCAPGGVIDSDLVDKALENQLGWSEDPAPASLPTLHLEELERSAIEQALARSDGNRARAAGLLGISRFALRRRLDRHYLEAGSSGDEESTGDLDLEAVEED